MKTIDGNIIPIPKFRQKIVKLENHNTHVFRTQFPVLLGYAITVHRVQEATLKKTHLYLDTSIFCEGRCTIKSKKFRFSAHIKI